MDTVANLILSIPPIGRANDYIQSLETHMDYEGQRKAEKIYQIIITLFGVVGFLWGFYIQKLSATVYIVLGGFALSCLIVLPPWPIFRTKPLQWQPATVKNEPQPNKSAGGAKGKESKKKSK